MTNNNVKQCKTCPLFAVVKKFLRKKATIGELRQAVRDVKADKEDQDHETDASR